MVDASAILDGRILIVDDQKTNVQLLDLMLQRAGYLNVTSTIDPMVVCELHLKNHYDLILLDLNMTGMDGFQVMEALKEIDTDNYLPVLVITAQPSQKLRALQAGAKDFISKPFDSSELLTRIHNMLEVRLLHRECLTHGKILEDTARMRTAELRRSEEMFRDLASNIPEALWIRDTEQRTVQYVNKAWQTLSGLSAASGDPLEKVEHIIHLDGPQWAANERRQTRDGQMSSEYRLVRPDQSVRWVRARTFSIPNPSGMTPWVAEIIEDVTVRREAQRQLLRLARHDALTDLPNRTLLYEALQEAFEHADENRLIVSVLLLDIDCFKNVNDKFGHTIGDAVLREFASRLAKCVRPGDTVGRLSGDEFVVIVVTAEDAHGAAHVAKRVQNALQAPLILQDHSIMVSASIGVASYPTDTSDLEALIRYADAAMYEAKASGKNALRFYTAQMRARTIEKSEVASALQFALERDEFILHYQPKMEIDSGEISSVEALLRWNRPGHGLVLPGLFVPALEEIGLIVPVGAWLINKACQQIRDWGLSGFGQIRIAVNVSSSQLREEQFVCQVAGAIQEHGIDPKLLEFEITESTLMAHGEATDVALRKLKDLGISIAIDDFGTGYSNLAYLKGFLVDALKIDIAFIRDVTTNADDATIVVAIINMAHSLRLRVIAEGVETREQLEFLSVHGCDDVQGYYISMPLPVDQVSLTFQQTIMRDSGPPLVSHNTRARVAHA